MLRCGVSANRNCAFKSPQKVALYARASQLEKAQEFCKASRWSFMGLNDLLLFLIIPARVGYLGGKPHRLPARAGRMQRQASRRSRKAATVQEERKEDQRVAFHLVD
jgi:hypothetical protein